MSRNLELRVRSNREWKNSNNEFHHVYSALKNIQMIKIKKSETRRKHERQNVHRILIRKPQEKKTLSKRKSGEQCGIKTDLREAGCQDVDWIHIPQDRFQ